MHCYLIILCAFTTSSYNFLFKVMCSMCFVLPCYMSVCLVLLCGVMCHRLFQVFFTLVYI